MGEITHQVQENKVSKDTPVDPHAEDETQDELFPSETISDEGEVRFYFLFIIKPGKK